MSGTSARIILDSLHPDPCLPRVTTMEVTFHRFVLAEFNTHRAFCLAGDSVLEFDLPSGTSKNRDHRRVHYMRLEDFADKWFNGARRYAANPKRYYDMSWVADNLYYSTTECAINMGMANAGNLNTACRSGDLPAERAENGRTWLVKGADLREWRERTPDHTRFDIRSRLQNMRIRQLNEDTGLIQTATVKDVIISGKKEVYEVIAGDYSVAGSLDHKILTEHGWKPIKDIGPGEYIVIQRFGKQATDYVDPLRYKKIGTQWTASWNNEQKKRLIQNDPLCRRCRKSLGIHIHHIVPVHVDASRAFDDTNTTLLCKPCHKVFHNKQGWQGGTYLYGSMVRVEAIEYRGIEQTYDLEIAGEFPNFVANSIIVHNSRNSASSRAIPAHKQIERVFNSPAIPLSWPKEQKGMQGGEALGMLAEWQAENVWIEARNMAIIQAEKLIGLGVHKSVVNRLLEPFMWHTVIVTATEWDNFWALRCNPLAQPEIRVAAEMMKEAYDNSTPQQLGSGQWHLPLVAGYDYGEIYRASFINGINWDEAARRISAARCARVSYLTHDGQKDWNADLKLAERLINPGDSPMHASPFEHVCSPADYTSVMDKDVPGNLKGWRQYRHILEDAKADERLRSNHRA